MCRLLLAKVDKMVVFININSYHLLIQNAGTWLLEPYIIERTHYLNLVG
jgi:hypothetical protein